MEAVLGRAAEEELLDLKLPRLIEPRGNIDDAVDPATVDGSLESLAAEEKLPPCAV